MTTTDTNLSQFVINELTTAQYNSITNPSDDELYILTDGKLDSDEIDDTNSTNKFVTSAEKTAIGTISGKQDTLVSGTNIKTINSVSVLGNGDIDTKSQSVTVLSGTSITLTDNSINTLTPTGNTTFTLPTVTDTTVFHQILVQLNLSTVYTIGLGTTKYFNSEAPDLTTAGNYNLIYEYDNSLSSWVVGCVEKGSASS